MKGRVLEGEVPALVDIELLIISNYSVAVNSLDQMMGVGMGQYFI